VKLKICTSKILESSFVVKALRRWILTLVSYFNVSDLGLALVKLVRVFAPSMVQPSDAPHQVEFKNVGSRK